MITIDETIARKCLETVDAGLVHGLGKPIPGQMCIEAAVNYAMGLPHGDNPPCVAPALRSLKIALNDANWPSDQARAQGMRRLALAQLGSAGELDEKEFARRVSVYAIEVCVPLALRAAAGMKGNSAHKDALLAVADRCEKEPTRKNAEEARTAAHAATTAAADAAHAAHAAAYAAAAADARTKVLSDFAEAVVQILVNMNAPGCQWLWMTDGEAA